MARKLKMQPDNNKPLTEEDVFWQYLLDHCMYETKAGFVIGNLVIPSKTALHSRLQARRRGLYRRDIKDIKYLDRPSFKRVWGKIKYIFARHEHR